MRMLHFLKNPFLFLIVIFWASCNAVPTEEVVEEKYETGKPKTIVIYEDSTKKVKVEERGFYEDGKTQIKGKLKNEKRNGLWTYWYPNGNKWSECEYKEGLKHGRTTVWYENGKKRYEGYYTEDKKSGEWKYWDEAGNLLKTE